MKFEIKSSLKIIASVFIVLFVVWNIASCKGYDKGQKDAHGHRPNQEGTIYTFKRIVEHPAAIWSEKSQTYVVKEKPVYYIIAHASWDRTYSEPPNSYVEIHIEDFRRLLDFISQEVVVEEQEAKW